MDFMLRSVEVSTGHEKYFVQGNAVGRSVNHPTCVSPILHLCSTSLEV